MKNMDDEINFSDHIEVVKNNRIAAGTAFLVVFLIVAAYTLFSSPFYEAKSLVLVQGTGQASLLGLGTNAGIDLETQRQIIQSPGVLYPVYDYYPFKSFTLTVTPLKGSDVIEIAVGSDSAEKAADIANRIAESYVNFTRATQNNEAREMSDFITEKLISYQKELDALNADKMSYSKSGQMTVGQQLAYQDLEREIAAKSKLYDYLLSKKEETGILASEKGGYVRILSYAELPFEPSRPIVPLYLAIGAVLGVIAGLGAAHAARIYKENRQVKKKFRY
jgi:uncharacterized protein involved in exopolysaccharide biosynthesis